MADMNEGVFTVKEWLGRLDGKMDRLDDKIDKVAEAMDRKADGRDLRDLQNRVTVIEQQEAARVDIYNRLSGQMDSATKNVGELMQEKADRSDVLGVQRLLVGAISGSALAILAWALTVFVR